MPNTKIVATIGPASSSDRVLRDLLAAGVDVFRVNASHGNRAQHAALMESVRHLAREGGRHVGLLFDLQGPKIRLGKFAGGGARLHRGQIFVLTTEETLGSEQRASTGYARFARDVKPGDRVLLSDGSVELKVLETDGVAAKTLVVEGGPVGDNKGINLPGTDVTSPSLTEKDEDDVRFAVEKKVDFVALSFVRTAEDVRHLRRALGDGAASVVAKIEKPQAWENIEEILDAADGVMVARGDLGVEMALEKVPRIQKSIIRRARRKGRVVITATQMLESMIENPSPTRAEVSDVANAIYDGTDAVMLSAETAIGKFPVEAVTFMSRIAEETEKSLKARGFQDLPSGPSPSNAEIVADAAYHAARDAKVSAIVVFTASGSSARLISRYRPPVCIYAMTPHEAVARRLSVHYGIAAVLAPDVASTDEMLALMDRLLVERGYLKPGEPVVFVAGQPIGRPGTTNLMKLHRIGVG